MTEESAPAGWYPQSDGTQRYWDGTQWTDHVSRSGEETPPRPPAKKGRGCLIAVLVVAALSVLLISFWTFNFFRSQRVDATAEPGATSKCGTPATSPGFDVQVGTPYLEDGKDLVPVTVTNNTTKTHDVIVALKNLDIETCQSPDGYDSYISARFDNLAPGQTAVDDAGSVVRLLPVQSLQGRAYQIDSVNVLPAKGSPYTTFDSPMDQ